MLPFLLGIGGVGQKQRIPCSFDYWPKWDPWASEEWCLKSPGMIIFLVRDFMILSCRTEYLNKGFTIILKNLHSNWVSLKISSRLQTRRTAMWLHLEILDTTIYIILNLLNGYCFKLQHLFRHMLQSEDISIFFQILYYTCKWSKWYESWNAYMISYFSVWFLHLVPTLYKQLYLAGIAQLKH